MTLFIYLLFIIILTILGIGSLIVVIRSNRTSTKYVAGGITFIVAILFFVQVITQRERISVEEKRIAGQYELNENQSELSGYENVSYGPVQLYLNVDNTFMLNKDVPFLPGKQGTWEHIKETNVQHSELIFTDAAPEQRRPIRFSAWGDSLVIYNVLSRGDVPFVPLLTFKRKI